MHAIVTEDVCFHLKANQEASPKKKGQRKGHCWLSVSETSDPFSISSTVLLFLFDLKDKEVKNEGEMDEKKKY